MTKSLTLIKHLKTKQTNKRKKPVFFLAENGSLKGLCSLGNYSREKPRRLWLSSL